MAAVIETLRGEGLASACVNVASALVFSGAMAPDALVAWHTRAADSSPDEAERRRARRLLVRGGVAAAAARAVSASRAA